VATGGCPAGRGPFCALAGSVEAAEHQLKLDDPDTPVSRPLAPAGRARHTRGIGQREDCADHGDKRRLPSLLTLAVIGVCVAAAGALLVGCLLSLALPAGPTD
jgi:hypothetical protein